MNREELDNLVRLQRAGQLSGYNQNRLLSQQRELDQEKTIGKGQTFGESLFSTGGGIAGGLAGAGLAAALAPFTGGGSLLAAALLSAAGAGIGAGGGELLRQKTTGEDDQGVNWGGVGKEAGISGAFGLLPGAIGLAKGGRAALAAGRAGRAASAAGTADDAARAVSAVDDVARAVNPVADDVARIASPADDFLAPARQKVSALDDAIAEARRLRGDINPMGTQIPSSNTNSFVNSLYNNKALDARNVTPFSAARSNTSGPSDALEMLGARIRAAGGSEDDVMRAVQNASGRAAPLNRPFATARGVIPPTGMVDDVAGIADDVPLSSEVPGLTASGGTRTGAMATKGQNFRFDAIRPDKAISAGGQGSFTAKEWDDVLKFDAEFLPSGSALAKARNIPRVAEKFIKQADDILAGTNQTMAKTTFKKQMLAKLTERGYVDPGDIKRANKILARLDKIAPGTKINGSQANQFRRLLNKEYSGALGSNTPLTGPQQMHQLIKEQIDDAMEQFVPKDVLGRFRAVNKQIAISNKVQRALNSQLGQNIGLKGAGATSGGLGRVVQSARDRAGRALQGIPKAGFNPNVADDAAGIVAQPGRIARGYRGLESRLNTPLGGQLAAQLGGRYMTDMVSPQDNSATALVQALQQAEESPLADPTLPGYESISGGMPTDMGGLGGAPQSYGDPQRDMLRQQLQMAIIQDLQATGGENVSRIKTAMQALGVDEDPTAPKLSADQQKRVLAANQTENILGEMEALLAQAGDTNRFAGLVKAPGRAIGVDPIGRSYDRIRNALIGPLARSISGEVGVLTDADIKRAEGLLPSLYNTPEENALILQTIRSLISANREATLNAPRSQPGFAPSSDLSAALTGGY